MGAESSAVPAPVYAEAAETAVPKAQAPKRARFCFVRKGYCMVGLTACQGRKLSPQSARTKLFPFRSMSARNRPSRPSQMFLFQAVGQISARAFSFLHGFICPFFRSRRHGICSRNRRKHLPPLQDVWQKPALCMPFQEIHDSPQPPTIPWEYGKGVESPRMAAISAEIA